MSSSLVAAVVLVAGLVVFGTGADRALVAQVEGWMGPRTLAADVSAVADRTFLTGEGRELLTLVGARSAHGDDLQRSCGATAAADDHAVGGCYSRAGILVFVPTDPRVADAAVTILAHELLHAAFDRLGAGEVWHVRDMLHAALDGVAADDPVRQQIDWSVSRSTGRSATTRRTATPNCSPTGGRKSGRRAASIPSSRRCTRGTSPIVRRSSRSIIA